MDKGELGYILLQSGFSIWFRYMFKAINNTPFECQPLHIQLLQQIENIIDGKSNRLILNICPRSGKTTSLIWLSVYALTVCPRAQIIYTSFNQELLSSVAQQVAGIMKHPIYQAMYGQPISESEEEISPVDAFWAEYLRNSEKEQKIKFSNRKIITPQGGIILFNSMGAAITGFGAGVRNYKGFSGFLCMDDPDKPTDVRSQKIRDKSHVYFQETLLSRLNNSETPIINTQQRLHLDDMSGFLIKKYGFEVFKFPLLDENGNCNLPKQYTEQRIDELKADAYTFSAQYQQEPILLGGGVIKHSWWRFYKDIDDSRYSRIFITADTANKTKEWNDYTAIMVFGLTTGKKLRLLDMIHDKLEIPELKSVFIALWDKWKEGIGTCKCSAIYIEDKASGTQIIQELRRNKGMPIQPIQVEHDKLTRVQNVIGQIAAGNVELPESENSHISREFLEEADAFTADDSHLHDDMVDAMVHGITQAFNSRGYF